MAFSAIDLKIYVKEQILSLTNKYTAHIRFYHTFFKIFLPFRFLFLYDTDILITNQEHNKQYDFSTFYIIHKKYYSAFLNEKTKTPRQIFFSIKYLHHLVFLKKIF